jgi:hypothetical protein
MSGLSSMQIGILKSIFQQVCSVEQENPRRLEKKGLIERIKGPNQARTVRILLTSEGRKVAEAITSH